MFASNFPVDKLFSSYDAVFDAFKEITQGFSADERRRLFHDNAALVSGARGFRLSEGVHAVTA
jgi:predicted TIM-barrel fold metal-dependent hydrolase